jgi:hypothetical protein
LKRTLQTTIIVILLLSIVGGLTIAESGVKPGDIHNIQ